MKNPNNVYKYIIAVEAFRSVGAQDKEYIMCEKLLDIVKSKETCMSMTNEDEEYDQIEYEN